MINDFGFLPLENYDKAQFEIEGTKLIKYTGENTIVKIPDGVIEICKNAFMGKSEITELYVPNSVRKIAVGEFCNCKKLKYVQISFGMAKDITRLKKLFGDRIREIEFSIEMQEIEHVRDYIIFTHMLKMFREGKITEEELQNYDVNKIEQDVDKKDNHKPLNTDKVDFYINFKKEDPILMDVMMAIAETGQASASFIHRKFKIGYERASKILDLLESKGMIGPLVEEGAREVYITPDILNRRFGAFVDKKKNPTVEIGLDFKKEDPHFKAVLKRIVQAGHASVEEIRKKLPINYTEISEILELFEKNGLVSSERDGDRDVYINADMYSAIFGEDPFADDEYDKELKAQIDFSTHPDLLKESLRLFIKTDDAGYAILQRKFSITYRDATKILAFLEKNNFIGEDKGDGHREVYISKSDFEALFQEPFSVTMHLADEPFKQITDGKKTVEIRLYDYKRQALEVGDVIRFVHENDSIDAKITDLIVVDNLGDFSREILDNAGFKSMPVEKIYEKVSAYYTEQEICKNMVLAIVFELIGENL